MRMAIVGDEDGGLFPDESFLFRFLFLPAAYSVCSVILAVQWLSSKLTNFGFVKTEVCCLLLTFYFFELEPSECKISRSSVSLLNMVSVVFVAQQAKLSQNPSQRVASLQNLFCNKVSHVTMSQRVYTLAN